MTTDLGTRSADTGPKLTSMWLDGTPRMVTGLDARPIVGDRFEVDGELWRVVERTDRIVLERESSQLPTDLSAHSRLTKFTESTLQT